MTYTIESKTSGRLIGTYLGKTEEEAADAMAADQGYADFRTMCDISGTRKLTSDELDAEVEREMTELHFSKA